MAKANTYSEGNTLNIVCKPTKVKKGNLYADRVILPPNQQQQSKIEPTCLIQATEI